MLGLRHMKVVRMLSKQFENLKFVLRGSSVISTQLIGFITPYPQPIYIVFCTLPIEFKIEQCTLQALKLHVMCIFESQHYIFL